MTGFDDKQINDLLFEEKQGLTDDDAVPDTPEEPISKLGDIWQLGKHRLLCGDATKEEDVNKLMNGQKADMVFTDPPYGVNYANWEGNAKNKFRFKKRPIENDNMNDEEFKTFLINFIINSKSNVKGGCPFYICYGEKRALVFLNSFIESGLHRSSNIIWRKQSLVLGRSDYHYQHEPIFYGWFKDNKHIFYGDRSQTSIWEFNRPTNSKLHPTMKPVELIGKAINNSSKQEDIIYEPFCGSGSTLIACEKLDRICYGIELDPKYCDVIVKRWEQWTGEKATK
jgi:DNA modification methylase